MSEEEFREYVKDYLNGLENEGKDEWWGTDRELSESVLEDFMGHLQREGFFEEENMDDCGP